MSDGRRKPSGAANRRARRERETRERAEHTARGDLARPPLPPCTEMAHAHLWTLGVLTRELHDLQNDPTVPAPERRRVTAELARAIGMLQTKAQLEAQIAELEAEEGPDDDR